MDNVELRRLDADHLLLLRHCRAVPDNVPEEFYVAEARPPHAIRAAGFGGDEPPGPTDNADFDGRFLVTAEIQDASGCGTLARWAWTGRDFALVELVDAPLCRGQPVDDFGVRLWTAAPR